MGVTIFEKVPTVIVIMVVITVVVIMVVITVVVIMVVITVVMVMLSRDSGEPKPKKEPFWHLNSLLNLNF